MREFDYNNAIAVTRDIHWVGYYDQEAQLHCNPYILVDEDDIVLFDPGSVPHFPVVMRKVIDTVNPKDITHLIISHEDPDVCGNIAVVEDVIDRKDLRIVAHSNSIRLIRHYGVKSRFQIVENEQSRLILKSGRVLEFIYTPYLHSAGAFVTYDHKTKSLFSSDIFGGISLDWSLFAGKGFIEAMDDFHRIYMPGNFILKYTMELLSSYQIERILPQHGSIIEGSQVKEAIDHLKTLPCGIDLMME